MKLEDFDNILGIPREYCVHCANKNCIEGLHFINVDISNYNMLSYPCNFVEKSRKKNLILGKIRT